MFPRTIRNFNAFIDGTSYFGRVIEGTLPKLDLVTENHRGGGQDGTIEIDMGMQGLKAELTFAEWSREHWVNFGKRTPLVMRPAALGQEDFEADSYIYTMRGRWMGIDPGTLKGGGNAPLKVTCAVDYYRAEMNGEELFEIDIENGKRIIGNEDQLASIRKAMGI